MIDRRRLLSLFQQLVSIDSPSYGEREICGFLKEKLSSLGCPAQEDDAAGRIGGSCGNLYCYVEGTLPPILFSAHMDTVEPSRGKRLAGIVVAAAINSCHSREEYTTEQELERAAGLALQLMLSKE